MGRSAVMTDKLDGVECFERGDEWHRQTPHVTRSRTKSGLGTPHLCFHSHRSYLCSMGEFLCSCIVVRGIFNTNDAFGLASY